jgi:hypothetical protein
MCNITALPGKHITQGIWKNAISIYSLIILPMIAFTQGVGIGTNSPHENALLEINTQQSTSKGFLITGQPNGPGIFPSLGPGKRLMFFPAKGAFRAGEVIYTKWDAANVGQNSFAVGFDTKASGSGSTALGFESEATGFAGTALGHQTHAHGSGSTAMGRYSNASGEGTVAMGYGSWASGKYSTAMGQYTLARGYASTVIGSYNKEIPDTAQNSMHPSTPLFIVGNGTGFLERSNALVVLQNGKIGMGVDAPTNPLSFPPLLGKKISLYPGNTGDVGFAVLGNQLQIYSDNPTSWVRLGYDQNGVFTHNLDVYGNGNAWLRGTLTQNSDSRLKKDIQPIKDATKQLQRINGYHYYWKSHDRDSLLQTGVLAQELQSVFPELVKEDKEGILSVNYSGIIPWLLEAAKEQQKELEKHQEKLLTLEREIEMIKNKLKNSKL